MDSVVRVGEKFDGFDVERWSANDDAVILRRDGERWAVPFAATSRVNSANETATSTVTAGIRDNLLRLAVRACEYLLEQATDRVAATDLVGSDGALQRLESVAGETYADLSFSVGRDGLEMVVDGRTVPLMPADDTIVVRVGPTLSLAAIGRQLHLPLARLEALNPRLGPERFSDWTSVRLQ